MRFKRRWVAVLGAALSIGVAFAFATLGNAGNSTADYSTFVAPTVLTAGNTGFAGAKFKPTAGGAATHVKMFIGLPDTASNIKPFSCPGAFASPAINPPPELGTNTAECDIASVQNGLQVKFVVTFTAVVGTAGPQPVAGAVNWDNANGGGSNGTVNENQPASPTGSYAVYAADDKAHAGACTSGSGTLPTLVEPNTGKGADKDTYNAATPGLGLPCTFAQVSIDKDGTATGLKSPGIWGVLSAQSSGLSHVFLTLNTIPDKVNWKNAVLREVFDNGSSDPVPLCVVVKGALTIPTTDPQHHECLDPKKPQSSFGSGGVAWSVWYEGTGVDPSSGY